MLSPHRCVVPMTTRFERLAADPGFQQLFRAARRRELRRNEVVIHQGDAATHLCLLVSGLMAVRDAGTGGRDLLLAYLYPGDFFGEMCLFSGVEARSAMVRAASAGSLLEVDYPVFIELTQRYPSLWLELAGQLASRLRRTNRRLAEMPSLNAAERVWRVIAEIAANIEPQTGSRIRVVRMTRQDLGKLAGCSRELAGAILQDLVRSGRIVLDGKNISVAEQSLTVAG